MLKIDEVDEMTGAMLDVEGREFLIDAFQGMMIVDGLEKVMRRELVSFLGRSHPELTPQFLDRVTVKFGGRSMVSVYLAPSSYGPSEPSAPRGGDGSGDGLGGGSSER